MKRLFEALELKHPGYKLIDIRFTIDPKVDVDDNLVDKLVDAINNAKKVNIQEIFGEST